MTRVVVTGAESFVGKRLLDLFDSRGIDYLGIDQAPPSRKNVVQASIQARDLGDALPEGADALIHLAALSRDPDCRNQGYKCFDVNVQGTLNLMDLAEKRKLKQFIFASTEWVYDRFAPGKPNDEETPVQAANLKSEYAFSKFVSEVNLRQKYSHGFCPTTILRFGIIYGPRPSNWSAVESLFHKVQQGGALEVGSLATGRCFLHVGDIAEAVAKSVGTKGFEIINIQGNTLVTLGDVIKTSEKLLGKKVKVTETDAGNPSVRWVANDKAKRLLGWEPKIGLEEGLKSLEPRWFQ